MTIALEDARERCGAWGPEPLCDYDGRPCRIPRCSVCPELPEYDHFEASVKRREDLEARFPGFTLEQVEAGLRVPASSTNTP